MHDGIGSREVEVLAPSNPAHLARAAALLRAGQIVAFPTDTVYGVGAPFSNPEAVQRLYLAKARSDTKGIPILLASRSDLPLVVEDVGQGAERLMAAYWPGPLTLVLPKSAAVPRVVTRAATVAVRIPDHQVARALIVAVGLPLAATSANLSENPPTVDPAVVRRDMAGRIAAVLDGGMAPGGMPSTIVDCTVEPPRIVRPGPIPAQEVLKCYYDHWD